MSIKDLFNRSSQVVVSSSLKQLAEDAESPEYISEYVEDQNRVEPHIDFSKPENFAKYGSAEEYYSKSLEYIYNEYPYDGSLKERIEWKNKGTLLDLYIFDNRYPKTTGYAILSSDGWGTLTGTLSGGYGAPSAGTYEYINVKGGPNSIYGSALGTASLSDVFNSKSNIFDQTVTGTSGPISATRQSNLQTDLSQGVTIEFWLQTGSLSTALTEKQVVFDLWNGQASSSAGYGRLRIELTGSGNPFLVTVMSGTDGYSQQSIGSGLNQSTLSSWGHYAFSFINSGSTIITRLYKDGELNHTLTTGTDIGEIRKDIEANIGALTSAPSGNVYTGAAIGEGWGKLSGSIDEFRFWKTRRTEKQISKNYFTSELGGGTNTDTANLDLGIYYKFNEGITGISSLDNIVLDYSGRISNGTWTGYPSSTARNTGSAIVSASAGIEDLDPIIFLKHPDVTSLSKELQLSGTLWDYENNSSLYYTMPSWIIEEDEGNGTTGDLRKLTQIMSSYLDNLDLLIGELPKLNMASYPSSSVDTQGEPNKVFKVYPYVQNAVRSMGLNAPELFSNGTVLEYYKNRNETKEFEEDLNEVKNLIYNNIHNNLTDIYKAKGTEKSFRNLIRCFGIGDDVIRINAYADNDTYKFETKRRATSVTTKAINLNHIDRFAGTVYQYADSSNPNSVSYISGSSTHSKTLEDGFPITLEAEVVFPKKIPRILENAGTQEFGALTASLFGMHTAKATSPTETDLAWASSDVANLQVMAIRDKKYSKDVKFMLTSSAPFPIPELTSSFYQNTYNNDKWNFAVRLKPNGYPQSFSSGALDNNYIVEFYGVNYIADRLINEFTLTGTVARATAESLLTAPKRIFVGSHKTNFTGSTLQQTDTKITSCRYWFDYLDNDAIRDHAIDPDNFGHPRPNRDSYLLEPDLPNIEVPEIESLALYWDFETVTGSDNGSGIATTFDGKFTVQDVTSGSIAETSRYGWIGKILRHQHTGRGDSFPINSTGSVENLFLYSGKQQLPEIVFGDDNIRVLSQEETEVFTKETRPTKTYYAFEKSMYQVISDEIINYFGSIADFNNIIGDPVNRYRHEYKSMNYLRQFFFERIKNTPDLDKFIEYYKWIDSTLEVMLMQLVPAAAQVSDGIDNVVESHVLERNKYWSKFPTLEFNTPDPEGCAISINKHLYDWEHGHRPIPANQDDNCFYWKERAERDDPVISSGDAGVDADRNSVLSASLQVLERGWCTPYRYTVEKKKVIHGGINYSENKKTNFYRGINFPHGPKTSIGLPMNVLVSWNEDIIELKDCNDNLIPEELQKKKYAFKTRVGRSWDSGSFDGIKGEIAMPFNLISASADIGGYNEIIQSGVLSGSQLVNLHNDGYGNRNETPMQGPFTQKYVGGHQYRHVRLNNYNASRVGGDGASTPNNLDGQYTRPEGWRILLGGGPGGVIGSNEGALGLTGPDYGGPYPDPQRFRAWWWREETTKRPVNIRNILQTTASVDTPLSGVLQHGPIGNYEKTYQVVQTSGRSTNNFWFNENKDTILLPERYATNNPATTNVHTLIGVRPRTDLVNMDRGNTFIPGTDVIGVPNVASLRRLSNRYYPFQVAPAQINRRTVFELPDRTKQNAVIVERFSAPGGPEINSLGFLDIIAAEKSVYNALPYRNLSVRGSGSGEEVKRTAAGQPIKVNDHLNRRRGLRTLANLHAGPFGSDATYGSVTEAAYVASPSYYKVNRNARLRIEGTTGDTDVFTYTTGSLFDTWHVQHPIPQNDFQYAWISASMTPGASAQASAFGHAPKSGRVSGSNGFEEAISFVVSTTQDYEAVVTHIGSRANKRIALDFVGLNTLIYDPTGSAFNILSASGGPRTAASYLNQQIATGGVYVDPTANEATLITVDPFNLLMLHRNGPHGYPSWRQVRGVEHSLTRQMRKNNTISIIDPDTLPDITRNKGYKGYEWGPIGLKTNDSVFGQQSKGNFSAEINQDRSVLQYHEPAIQQKFKTMEFDFAMAGFSLNRAVATYANNKKYFVNSKLNSNLFIDENQSAPADLVIDSYSITSLNKLLNARYTESVYPASINVYRSHIRGRTNYSNDFWKDERVERNATNKINSQGVTIASASIWPLDARLGFDSTNSPEISVAVDDQEGRGGAEGELQNSYNTIHTRDEGKLRSHAAHDCSHRGAGSAANIIAAPTYNRRQTLATGSSARSRSSAFGSASQSYGSPGLNVVGVEFVPRFSGDAPWEAGAQSGKNPFYNSYDEYAEEMKRIGKDYSIIPEYRISERVEDYLINGVDRFNDTSLFNVTGGLANTTSSNETNFYKVYSHSDFMKYFDVTKEKIDPLAGLRFDPTEGSSATEITVTCNALLKLLPYDGFYPASRTLQLATLFSQSYGNYLTLTGSNDALTNAEAARALYRPFLTPMFAPGILYNTIKSGIAVDFPILTGSLRNANPLLNGFLTGTTEILDDPDNTHDFTIGNNYFSYRVPFEALVEPENYLANFTILDMEPHPSASLNATASWDGQGDSRFKRAMNNFLAETAEFFLEDGTFSSFSSKPKSLFSLRKDKTYKMRVQIKKSFTPTGLARQGTGWNSNYVPQIVSGTETMVMYSRPTAFGPPCRGGYLSRHNGNKLNGFLGGSRFGYNAPFTPPYYDGSAWVDLTYVPSSSSPTIDDIFAEISSSYRRYATNIHASGEIPSASWGVDGGVTSRPLHSRRFFAGVGRGSGSQQGEQMNSNAVQITASLNLFGKVDYTDPVTAERDSRWMIQTKFETPILNFIDADTSSITDTGFCSGGLDTRPIGMWHQYGRLPKDDEGIYLEVKDHPDTDPLDISAPLSLADAVGFPKADQKLGRIAESKTIREAVVAVPFVEIPRLGERQFFRIERSVIDDIKNNKVGSASITNMVEAMQRYVFPPSMDFYNYPDKVTPFSMYIFEFEHQLNQEDLSDIWQNLPPRIGRAFQSENLVNGVGTDVVQQTKSITHTLNSSELLDSKDLDFGKVQWMVFKVKQKAATSYFDKIVAENETNFPSPIQSSIAFNPSTLEQTSVTTTFATTAADQINKAPDGMFEYLGGGAAKGAITSDGGYLGHLLKKNVTYNWPYDFFSLVELVKIDEQVEFSTGREVETELTTMNFIESETSLNEAPDINFEFNNHNAVSIFVGRFDARDPTEPKYTAVSVALMMEEQFEIGSESAVIVLQAMENALREEVDKKDRNLPAVQFIIDAFDGHNIYTFEIKDPLVDEVSYQVYAEKNYKGEGSVYIRKKVNLKSVEE